MKPRLIIESLMLVILSFTTIYFALLSFSKVPVHDVAIVYVSSDLTQNHINGTVKNEGTQTEYFNVTAYCNDAVVGTEVGISLQPGASETLSFPWNTTLLQSGDYLVRVATSVISGETDIDDNSLNTHVSIMHNRGVAILLAYYDRLAGNITAFIRNEGDQVESFDVTAYYNCTIGKQYFGEMIGTLNIIELESKTEKTLEFPWDMESLPHGNYSVKIVASAVRDESNTTNNSFAFSVPEIGGLYGASECFDFTAISTDASMVSSGEIQMISLHFNITAIKTDVHNVTIYISGMTDSVRLPGLLYKTSVHVDIYFDTPYQSKLSNEFYPVNMTVLGEEIDPERQHVILSVPSPEGPSYTIWRGTTVYYARNDWSQMIVSQEANFTSLFQQVQSRLNGSGGIINLESGFYEGWIVIGCSGITVQGQSVYDYPEAKPNGTRKLPDDSPDYLMGTVLRVNVAGKDGIHLRGRLTGVTLRNLGIEFTQNITGHGISDDMDQNYHLSYCDFENIMILDHDKSHYAIQLSNFLHLDIKDIYSWGGPLLNLYGNIGGFESGNSNFYNIYGYIKFDLAPVGFVEGPYPIFVHKNDSLSSVWINFLHFYRIQINCPFTQTDSDFCVSTLWDLRYSTIDGLDLEGSGHTYEGNKLKMGSCYNVEFNNAFMWSMINNIYVNVASGNGRITFENCWICGGSVLDSVQTDIWRGCTIEGTINPNSLAHFIDLSGNSGSATLSMGSIRLNVTAKFMPSYAAITIVPMNSNQSLTIKALFYGANTFTIECTDGLPAGEDITFFWTVQS